MEITRQGEPRKDARNDNVARVYECMYYKMLQNGVVMHANPVASLPTRGEAYIQYVHHLRNSHLFPFTNSTLAQKFKIPLVRFTSLVRFTPLLSESIMYFTAIAIVALQLVSHSKQCDTGYFQPNNSCVEKSTACTGGGRNRGRPVTFTCRNKGTTLTFNGDKLTFKTPNENSQVIAQCRGAGNAYWLYCGVGTVHTFTWVECKNEVEVWSARLTDPNCVS